jgi:hypothetical protein
MRVPMLNGAARTARDTPFEATRDNFESNIIDSLVEESELWVRMSFGVVFARTL